MVCYLTLMNSIFLKQKHVAEQCHKVPFEISNAHFKEKKINIIFLQKNKVRILISWYFMNTFYFHKCKKEDFIFDTYVHKLYALNL